MWFGRRNCHQVFRQCVAADNLERLVKRITFTVMAVGLFVTLSTVFLVGYGIYTVNRAFPINPDPDLAALEQLVARKLIVLTREQKDKLAPIVKGVVENQRIPEKVKGLKEDMWKILDSNQIKVLKNWKEEASREAGGMLVDGRSALKKQYGKYKNDWERKVLNGYNALSDQWSDSQKQVENKLLKMLE